MKDTKGEKLFFVFNYFMLCIVGLSCLLPLIHTLSVSLSDAHAVRSGFVSLWPSGFSLESYKSLISGTPVVRAFQNSLLITVVGVVLSMVFTVMAAYPLARKSFYLRRFLTLAIVFTMLFSGGIIPTFLLIKELGLINSYWSIWLPGLVSAYNMLVLKSFLENIPAEIEEAARIDGCSELGLLTRIVLPLSLPVIAALTLFYGVHYWNIFMSVLLYIQNVEMHNLTVMVQQMVNSQSLLIEINKQQPDDLSDITPEGIKSAGIIVMVLPMLIVYPLLQKYFVKGVMIGAIKG
ncbi:carbohydrate ABC transporter permease [Paenibacillus thalictri]|uniref:Carbohydrate ABC transporter permease n=1 Tax=Paenibacillus thalictri TaxID=2527873 RepID=A0A4Q9DHU0_9BACL|nr:carbohydrate ABC transporter permease [Paenibacillus thalictri]TBL69387.1 carbohydrate ABC transporter permease [Paenibacillus thalictri]